MNIISFREELPTGGILVYGEVSQGEEDLKNQVELSEEEELRFNKINNQRRKTEWLFVRYLLQKEIPHAHITYEDSGKPRLVNSNLHISISHTENFVAVLLSEFTNSGLDVQVPKKQLSRIKHKFTADQELHLLDAQNIIHLCLLWSAKEAMYKMYGKGGVDFKGNMQLTTRIGNGNVFNMNLLMDEVTKEYKIWHRIIDGIVIAWIEE